MPVKNKSIMFRFQTGSIKSRGSRRNYVRIGRSFDSKLVRLKVRFDPDLVPFQRFRFQTGSIKSPDGSIPRRHRQKCFDSKLVRLKGV